MESGVLDDIYKELKEKMEKAVVALKDEMGGIRTGRANPAILERIKVDYYGTPTDIRQMAQITIPDPHSLALQPYDKSALKDIEKAIQKSDLGITPSNDGKLMRLTLPQLTSERRQELVKQVRKKGEDKKIVLRNHRREANETVKKEQKDGALTEDQAKHALDQVQKMTDQFIAKIDDVIRHKETDVTTV